MMKKLFFLFLSLVLISAVSAQSNGVFKTLKMTKTSTKIDEFSNILTEGNANSWQNDNMPTGKAVTELVNKKLDTLKGGLIPSLIRYTTTTSVTPLEIDTLVIPSNKVGIFDIQVSSADNTGVVNFWHKKVVIKNVAGTYTIIHAGNVVFVDNQASALGITLNGSSLPVVLLTGLATSVKWSSLKIELIITDL